jgi:tetratricopeptide (TPR) repeat protein
MRSLARCSAFLLALAVMVACASSTPPRSAEVPPEVDPTNPLAATLLMQQGRALVNEGKVSEGMEKYKVALKLQPDNPTLHNLIGVAELQRGEPGKALESFNHALSNRGAAYMQLAQYSLAESDFLTVLLDNTYANRSGVYYNLGSLYFVRGNLAAAEENLRRATKDGGPVEAYFLLGQVEEKLGKVALAETAYRDAMTRAPDRPDVTLALAKLVDAQGRKGEARELYLKVIAAAPGSPEAQQARVRLE